MTERLTKKQKKVMEQLFEATEDETTILANNRVTRRVFNNWLAEDAWIREFDRRIEESRRRTQIIISSFQPSAAIKLVELTNCGKEQTARQACLDIIQMPRIVSETNPGAPGASVESLGISEDTQNSIVELLAKDARKNRDKKSDIGKGKSQD